MTSKNIDSEIGKIYELHTIKDLIDYLSTVDENLKIDTSNIQYFANLYGADFKFTISILVRDYEGHVNIE